MRRLVLWSIVSLAALVLVQQTVANAGAREIYVRGKVDPVYPGDIRYWDSTGYGGFRGPRPGKPSYDRFGASACERTLRVEEPYGLLLRREKTCR